MATVAAPPHLDPLQQHANLLLLLLRQGVDFALQLYQHPLLGRGSSGRDGDEHRLKATKWPVSWVERVVALRHAQGLGARKRGCGNNNAHPCPWKHVL